MRSGKNIDQIIAELEHQRSLEYDMIVPRKRIQFDNNGPGDSLQVLVPDHDPFRPNEVFVEQSRELAGIPARYFAACEEKVPGLAALNLNQWFAHSEDEQLVRTFYNRASGHPGIARANLSPTYDRTWGHSTMFRGLVDAADVMQGVEFVDCEITEKRMYLRAILPGLEGTIAKTDARKGDAFRAGFEFRNSETGYARGLVCPFVEILSCTNGMTMLDFGAWSKIHRGKREEVSGELRVVFASDTVQARRDALAKEIRDALRQICTMETVSQIQDSINGVAHKELADPNQSLKLLAKSYDLTQEETRLIDANLTISGDRTRWGLIQAVTATASRVESYDRASDLQALGAKLLAPSAWTTLEKAA